ncbi:uncharacterized protein LOC144913965 [Branchiostoma floridae x Branchiostoma belcheri]
MSRMGALKTVVAAACVSTIFILLIQPAHAGSSFTTNPDIFDESGDPGRRTLPPRAEWETAIADLVSRYRHLILEILGDASSSSTTQERRSTSAPATAASETEMSQSQLRNVVNRYRQLILRFLRRDEATDMAAQRNVSRSPAATGETEGK